MYPLRSNFHRKSAPPRAPEGQTQRTAFEIPFCTARPVSSGSVHSNALNPFYLT